MSSAATSSNNVPISSNNTNRIETQKLYMTLLQFSLYDNPNRYYSRKLKLKRVPQQPTQSGSAGPTEYIISSSVHPPSAAAGAAAGATAGAASTRLRKKMKLTSNLSSSVSEKDAESEPESPKGNKSTEEEQVSNVIIFHPVEYEKIKNVKYSLADLKTLCSYYGIKKSGTKPELTQRIYTHLKQSYYIVRIQRIFRNFISRKYRTLCGPGYLHITNCVNDMDFYTFDKLSNIKPTELFTYCDNDNKIYGFHIASFFHLSISS